MNDFLDAECVLTVLFNRNILTKKNWKLAKGMANSYNVTFELGNSARIVGFAVYIKGTYHCIGVTALRNQSRRFNFPVDDILVQCLIS